MASPPRALPPLRIAASILTLLRDPAWEGSQRCTRRAHPRVHTGRGAGSPAVQEGRRLWTLSEQLVARAGR